MTKIFRFIEYDSTLKRMAFETTEPLKKQIINNFKLKFNFKFFPSKTDSEKSINEIDINQLADILNKIDSKILYLQSNELKNEKSQFATHSKNNKNIKTQLCNHGDNDICINCVKKDVWIPELYKQRKNIPYLALNDRYNKTKKPIKSEFEEYINELYNECINKIPMCECDKSKLMFENINNGDIKIPRKGNKSKCIKCLKIYAIKPQEYRYIDHVTFDYKIPDMYFRKLEKSNQLQKDNITFGILIGEYKEFDNSSIDNTEIKEWNTGTSANIETIYFPESNMFENAIDFHKNVSKKPLKKTIKCVCGTHKSYFTDRNNFKLSFFESLKVLIPILQETNKNIIGMIYNRNTKEFTPQEMEFISEMQNFFSINKEVLNKEYQRREKKLNKQNCYEIPCYFKNKEEKKNKQNGSLFITCILEPNIDTEDINSYEINAYQVSDLLTEGIESNILSPSYNSFVIKKDITTYKKEGKDYKTQETKSLDLEYFLISIPTGSLKKPINIFNNEIIMSYKLFEIKKYLKDFFKEDISKQDSEYIMNINFLVYFIKLNCICKTILEDPTYYNIIVNQNFVKKIEEFKSIDFKIFLNKLIERDTSYIKDIFIKYFPFFLEEDGWSCSDCTYKNKKGDSCEMCNRKKD